MAIFRNPLGSPFPTGTNPVSNATADLNGDGHLDLLFTNYISDNVSVLFGDGQGRFIAGASVPTTNGPRQIMVGDLDGDGDIDFLATNYSGNNVTVARNNGDGTFTLAPSVPVGTIPRGLGIGDLDGDGDLDFVSANYNANTLSIALNNGDATFAAPSSIVTGGNRPVQIVVANFDGDGDLDIAVTNNSSGTVGILLNNGNGTFAAATVVATGAGPRGLAAGDVDGDGDSDLVVGNFSANTASILLNDGTGAFVTASTVTTGNNPYDVKLGDLDGDGDLDMVVSNSGSGSLGVFFNNGSGTFTPAGGSPFAVGISPGGISLGDFDRDGDLDIASSNFGSNSTHILLNAMSRYSVASAASAAEGNSPGAGGELVFVVSRTATSEAETITYTLGGTATAGTDYTAPSGTISFAVGQSTAEIRISITSDDIIEPDETIVVTLAGASGEGRLNPDVATGTITDDDLNHAPSGTDGTITAIEDTARVLTAADFGFTDADGHSLAAVRMTTLPGAGTLTLNDVAMAAGQLVSIADINAGRLAFKGARDASGVAYATLTFQVQDNGGTAGGGINLDPTPNTLTIDVTPVNDAPSDLTAGPLSVAELAANGAIVGTIGVVDADGPSPNVFSLLDNAGGRFAINSATGRITVANGLLLDFEQARSHQVTVQVRDGLGGLRQEVFTINLTDVVQEQALGGGGGDRFVGGTGSDKLVGYGGNDTLAGGAGNDTLFGGVGSDTMTGGTGDDLYYVDHTGDRVIELAGQGFDRIIATGVSYALPANVESLAIVGNGLTATGSTGNDALYANGSGNTLIGLAGNDSYAVNASNTRIVETATGGSDLVRANGVSYSLANAANVERLELAGTGLTGTGTSGAETLVSKGSGNTLKGLGGNDIYVVNAGDTVVEAAGGGTDLVYASVSQTLAANVESLVLTGSGNLAGTGNDLANLLTGNSGANRLSGLAGNDVLTGGLGADTLFGGAGNDIFDFNTIADSRVGAGNRDIIGDFAKGQDKIDLSTIDANSLLGGNQTFAFLGTAAFTGAGQLRYVQEGSGATAKTVLSGNVDAGLGADFHIELKGHIALTSGDFIL